MGDGDGDGVSLMSFVSSGSDDASLFDDNVANTMAHIHATDETMLLRAQKRPSYDADLQAYLLGTDNFKRLSQELKNTKS